MKIDIGISDKNRKKVAEILNKVIADEFVLLVKIYNYHWNIHRGDFKEMHELYETQYKQLHLMIDETAERIPQLGHKAAGSLKAFLSVCTLKEGPDHEDQQKQVMQLVRDHESIIKTLRADIKICDDECEDAVTVDMLTKVMAAHEKMVWMLRSYIR